MLTPVVAQAQQVEDDQLPASFLGNGDQLEALADPTYAMLVNGFTYHPQNVTLLQWFVGQQPSSAIAGAYTFPNLSLQTTPSLSYRKDCTAPLP